MLVNWLRLLLSVSLKAVPQEKTGTDLLSKKAKRGASRPPAPDQREGWQAENKSPLP